MVLTRPDAKQNVLNLGQGGPVHHLCLRGVEITGGSHGLRRTYVEVTEPPFAPMVPTYARVRADPSWRHLTLASGHDAMVISPELLADLLLGLAA